MVAVQQLVMRQRVAPPVSADPDSPVGTSVVSVVLQTDEADPLSSTEFAFLSMRKHPELQALFQLVEVLAAFASNHALFRSGDIPLGLSKRV